MRVSLCVSYPERYRQSHVTHAANRDTQLQQVDRHPEQCAWTKRDNQDDDAITSSRSDDSGLLMYMYLVERQQQGKYRRNNVNTLAVNHYPVKRTEMTRAR